MILIDTSVWVNHLRRGDPAVVRLLQSDEAACHPFVISELACGNIQNRSEILGLLRALPLLPKARDEELLLFIDSYRLMGKGLGLIDIHLLASCQLARAQLLTRDKNLAARSRSLGLYTSADGKG